MRKQIEENSAAKISYEYQLKRHLIPKCVETFRTNIDGKIFYDFEEAGSFHLSVFKTSLVAEAGWSDPFQIFDCASGDAVQVYEDIFDSRNGGIKKTILKNVLGVADEWTAFNDFDVLYLDSIYIKKEFQKLRISSYVIYSLLEGFKSMAPMCAVVPCPVWTPYDSEEERHSFNSQSEAEYKRLQKRLVKLYSKLGFVKLRGATTMVKNLTSKAKSTPYCDEIFETLNLL